jgi:hypothetical protein
VKSLGFKLSVVLLSFSTVTFAQSEPHNADPHNADPHKSDSAKSEASKPAAPKSEAQIAFGKLKALEGSWEGRVTTVPPQPEIDGKLTEVSLRVTSMGNALLHNMKMAGRPDDPITMLYLDQGRLLLTHYCDAGNRPRMAAKASPDGKTVAFDFLDVAGPMQYGHMHNAAFTVLDANNHVEEWTYMLPGDKAVRARFELKRKK